MQCANKPNLTLDDLERIRLAYRKRSESQKKQMSIKTQALFAPPAPAGSRMQQMVNTFEQAMAVYDGVMFGLKLMRRARQLFSRR